MGQLRSSSPGPVSGGRAGRAPAANVRGAQAPICVFRVLGPRARKRWSPSAHLPVSYLHSSRSGTNTTSSVKPPEAAELPCPASAHSHFASVAY